MIRRIPGLGGFVIALWLRAASSAQAHTGEISGVVRDETGGALPGVLVELRDYREALAQVVTDGRGAYQFQSVAPGEFHLSFTLINFAAVRRPVIVLASGTVRVDLMLHLALSADVTVTGKGTFFTNLADAEDPAQNLVGIAQSASQGAITGRQLDARPVMRSGDVLETVPGVVISQHSGEGKANQYYLRGFNLDHGTDFATMVAGMPVNLPTHGHGHGYSDVNFLIPELVSGVQFSKGPYFAEQGDFATAGAANITYVNALAAPIVRVARGADGYGRAVAAASTRFRDSHVLGAVEAEHNDGPWTHPDDYRKVNGIVRVSHGDRVNGFSLTGMGYHGTWNSTDQIPERALSEGLIGRFGSIDPTDGGESSRYSGSFEWQRARGNASTRVTAYGIASNLDLFSNFTFYLDDPVNGDQFQQTDRRFVSGARIAHRRLSRWGARTMQNTIGAQFRNDNITTIGLYHTKARAVLATTREDAVVQSSLGVYGQNEVEWTPYLRTLAGVRVDGYRFHVDASDPANGGTTHAGLVSPKAGAVIGPWRGSELYVNAGFGFHSNDARGATITRDPITGTPADRVTPLVRARGAELGVRTVAVPHLQSSVALWMLNLDSELVFVGDAGTTEAGRPSHRQGVEWANYFSPRPWLTLDGDISISRARFTDVSPEGDRIPGAVQTVVSAGATVDSLRRVFGSVRLRYFGPRPLVADDSARSKATSLVNAQVGYKLGTRVKIALDLFNILDSRASDIDYYYSSRLPGEPTGGVADIHAHPTLPRTARVNLILGF